MREIVQVKGIAPDISGGGHLSERNYPVSRFLERPGGNESPHQNANDPFESFRHMVVFVADEQELDFRSRGIPGGCRDDPDFPDFGVGAALIATAPVLVLEPLL